MDGGNRQEKEMWVQRALLLLALLALLPPAGAYPARLTRAVSSYAVGGAGPMGIAQLQAGTAQTCAVGAAAANGYQAGQVYTITMQTNGQHKFEPSAGTVAGLAYNQNSYQWTAPNTGVAPVTFRALCATGQTTGYLASSTVQSGGGGGQQFVRTGDDYCSNGPNRYFCANDCNKFYYCNGQARGQNVNCPSGTRCMKLGPHRKYFDTDSQDNFDTADVTYACEKDADWGARSAKCWATPSAGKGECEVQNNKDRTCSGGGYCRSSLLDCKTGSGFEQTRPCKYDTPGGDCQCTTSILQPATDFDPTYSNNASIVSSEGRQCSIVEPGVRKQCNPPMDVLFVMDSSASIVTGGGVDGNREYAKARAFVKKFTSFFVLSSTETKVGYVSFSGDVTIVDANGDQKCANSLAKDWIVGDSPKNAIDIDSLHCVEAGAGDLDHVLLDDPSKVARSVDQKMQRGGTKMFLGMALARRILAQEKKAGRDQIVVCFP